MQTENLYFSLLVTIILLQLSCNPFCDDLIVDCDNLGGGEVEVVSDVYSEIQIGNAVVADADSVGHLVLQVGFFLVDTSGSASTVFIPLPHSIESASTRIFDTNNKLLFESNEYINLQNPILINSSYHLWDVQFEGSPYLGEFLVDLDFKFDQGRTLTIKGAKMLSVTCDELQQCQDNFDECSIGDCRFRSVQLNGGISYPPGYPHCS